MIPAHDDFLPDLVQPTMICAFSGWNDAGEAATRAVEHLSLLWDATEYGVIESEDYYDYQVNRPEVRLLGGVSRDLTWPKVHINLARRPRSGRDLVIVTGPEPNLKWKTFCDEILDVARDLNVEEIVLLGGMSTDTHFERTVPITGSAWDEVTSRRYSFDRSGYHGPTEITGVLHDFAVRAGFPAISLWAGTPYYVSAPAWAPATVALIRWLEELLEEPIRLENLQDEAEIAISTVRRLLEADPSMREQIDALADEPEVNEGTVEQLTQDVERYLRRRGGDTG